MNIYETLAYGKRQGFVFLRYVSVIFFFLSQFATYFIVLNALNQAKTALDAIEQLDVITVIRAVMSFKIDGAFGVLIQVMRGLGSLVIPLYFIATISFVLNLNRGEALKITQRTAVIALIMFIVEFFLYTFIVGLVMVLLGQLFAILEGNLAEIIEVLDEVLIIINAETDSIPFANAAEALAFLENLATTQTTILLLRNMPSFNIFLDQLLCLLMCLFFSFRPKWANTKFKLIFFRSLGIIPIAYILATFVVNGLLASGVIYPKLLIMCMFPAKRLPHFLFVVCILICNKLHPIKQLGTCEGMKNVYIPSKKVYRATPLVFETPAAAKKRSLDTAIFLSVCLILLSAADFVAGMLPFAAKWGLGKSYYAVFCVPFLFFFDDRKPVSKKNYNVYSLFYFVVIIEVILIYLFY